MTFAVTYSFNSSTVGYSTRQARTTVIFGYEYFGVVYKFENKTGSTVHVVQTAVT